MNKDYHKNAVLRKKPSKDIPNNMCSRRETSDPTKYCCSFAFMNNICLKERKYKYVNKFFNNFLLLKI
jgi:hypothetical protein